MSEDFMIRAFEDYQKQTSVEHQEHEKRIQEVDGGFFETFGHLFREKSIYAAAKEKQEKEDVAKEVASLEAIAENAPETTESEEVPPGSDSESEDQTSYISTALNIDELYAEMLYVLIHNVGCDVSYEVGQTALLSYIQDAFKIDNKKHQDLFDMAQKKEPPEMLLNIEVIEAKDLVAKDPNGLADPFVTLYLTSNTSQRYNSSVKPTTLSPVWEEHFALPIPKNPSDDTLCLEVWDFDPAETVGEKFGKFFDVKGVKGMRRLVKEIAVAATSGQHRNELVGRAQIPLNAIPASGMTMWYSLDKKNKVTRQGVIKVRVAFSSEKSVSVAAQEHRHLLRILLLHELETSKVAPFWWCGSFSPQADALITQHVAQSGLSQNDIALAQWIVYTNVHRTHPLSFDLFAKILEKLCKPIQYATFEEEDTKLFWDATKKLIPTCLSVIRKIRKNANVKEKNHLKQVAKVLSVLGTISTLDPPENIEDLLGNCVLKGARDWFEHVLENTAIVEDTDETRLKRLVKVVQLVRTDLQKAIEYYDKLFQESLNFKYAQKLYKVYQSKLTELIQPDVQQVSETMARMPHVGFNNIQQVDTNQPMAVGTTLFELYLYIQRFVILGTDLCPTEHETFEIRNFYIWFYSAVAQWLDIALYKALQRIDKAVDLDKLVPVDAEMKISSSAIDSLSIFYQIKVFWQELNWPDIEGSYTFIAKIIDDICRCCVYYADRVSGAVEGMGEISDVYEKRFQVTNEWCLAINNIDYVLQSLIPFTKEMDMDQIIEKLSDLRSPVEAQRCQHTLDTVIVNAVDTVRNKIIELLETVAEKMKPSMRRLLIEGAELFQQDCNSIDKVMRYLDDNLHTLHDQLNEENFSRILDIIWDYLNDILTDLIQSNLEKRRPPSFFANLHETLKLMKRSFKLNDDGECEALQKTEHLLYLNGLETAELIHQVHLELWKEQENLDSSLGQLTVKCRFDNSELKIEILNAKNLVAMDSNGLADSFIRVHLLPEERFTNVTKPKTQTHHKTLFPLYDEKFTLKLTTEQRNLGDALILFSCKDYDMLGYNNQYIGEAFVHFKDVPSSNGDVSQILLNLHRPKTIETDALRALEYRQGDKQAKEFLRRFKMRMNVSKMT